MDAALYANMAVQDFCVGDKAYVDVAGKVDTIADAYRASGWSSNVRKVVRLTASTLHTCGADLRDQADRLDALADAH